MVVLVGLAILFLNIQAFRLIRKLRITDDDGCCIVGGPSPNTLQIVLSYWPGPQESASGNRGVKQQELAEKAIKDIQKDVILNTTVSSIAASESIRCM